MSEFYTPTAEKVRALYVEGAESEEATGEQFDRWLNQAKAEAWDEGYNHRSLQEDGSINEFDRDHWNPYKEDK